MVLMYGVVSASGSSTPRMRARCDSAARISRARSAPSAAMRPSSASIHSCISCGSACGAALPFAALVKRGVSIMATPMCVGKSASIIGSDR
jgi:hypothetical protein